MHLGAALTLCCHLMALLSIYSITKKKHATNLHFSYHEHYNKLILSAICASSPFSTLISAIKEDLVDTKDERTHLYTHCHAFGDDVCVRLSTLVRLFSKLPTLRGAQVQVFFVFFSFSFGRINAACWSPGWKTEGAGASLSLC